MALVTCCPKCESEYEVTADQLKLHDGLVRCGQCSHVFDGFACLKNALPTLTRKVSNEPLVRAGTPESTPVLNVLAQPIAQPQTTSDSVSRESTSQPAGAAPAVTPSPALAPAAHEAEQDGPFVPSVDRQATSSPQMFGRQEPGLRFGSPSTAADQPIEPSLGNIDGTRWQAESREPRLGSIGSESSPLRAEPSIEPKVQVFGESRLKGDDPSAFGRTVPDFLEDDEPVTEGAQAVWLVGSTLLALVLIIQLLVVFRNDIVAAAPSLRPYLVQLCQPLSCEVSYVRQIDRIFIVGSSLQQAPDGQAGGTERKYVLRLTLQNRSPYSQPWPALMLTLTDASGTAVIRKALLPSEFLPPDLLEGPMVSRKELGLDIPLSVEGLSISGYELERFFP